MEPEEVFKMFGSVQINVKQVEPNPFTKGEHHPKYVVLTDEISFKSEQIEASKLLRTRLPELWIFVSSEYTIPTGLVTFNVNVSSKNGTRHVNYWYVPQSITPANDADPGELIVMLGKLDYEIALVERSLSTKRRKAYEIRQTLLLMNDQDVADALSHI